MRSCLIQAERLYCKTIVIPAFGACTGKVPYDIVAKMMYLAYKHLDNPPIESSWGYASAVAKELRS
jgi:O-acetyl-ADP-ribose deacetylase (regulator of RNase III)